MQINEEAYHRLREELKPFGAELVVVSKTKPAGMIKQVYDLGQRDFGENYLREVMEKHEDLPEDVRWHFIGHLQSNKAKATLPLVHLIQGVDSVRLLEEINRQAGKLNLKSKVLLQVHIADEETKFGFNEVDVINVFESGLAASLGNVGIVGLMGIATNTEDEYKVSREFRRLKNLFDRIKDFSDAVKILSMGMTQDYRIALSEGSTMIRIGSAIMGSRG